MLYINNEIQPKKDKDLFFEFQNIYKDYLNKEGTALIKPVTIKYTPDLIRYESSVSDENGRIKKQQPRSLSLNFVSRVNVGGEMVEMRYSPTAPIRGKEGVLTWSINQQDIEGHWSTTDIDLVYFFEFFSTQNAEKHDSEFAKLMVQDNAKEAAKEREAKKREILINQRLWNNEDEGGSKTEKLYEFAESVGYKGVRAMDENSLRKTIEAFFKEDRFGKQKFINFTDIFLTREEKGDFKAIEAEARRHELIAQINPQQSFCWKNDDGSTGDLIFNWSKVAGDEKPHVKFMQYLKENPQVVEKMKERIAEKNLQEA
jgi:hypothetical protein